ncbi:putative lipoprotein [Enterobacteriaceae bacterium ATCC 29904]|nr:putative lipoprotein [Enterobacteriaceae bacterium ATCC 29904]
MKPLKLIILTLFLSATACSTHKSAQERQQEAAEQCMVLIDAASTAKQKKGIRGEVHRLTISIDKTVRDGAFAFTGIRTLPYITSTYMDKGVEGSAWRECMENKLRNKSVN